MNRGGWLARALLGGLVRGLPLSKSSPHKPIQETEPRINLEVLAAGIGREDGLHDHALLREQEGFHATLLQVRRGAAR